MTGRASSGKSSSWGFGQRWWQMLEQFGYTSVRVRARSAARRRRVEHIEIGAGTLRAQVRDLDPPRSYAVELRIEERSDEQWLALIDRCRADPLLVSCLCAGEVPSDLEVLCRELAIPVFPAVLTDLVSECRCHMHDTPCDHLAVVHAHIAEALDRDPGLLFQWRGMSAERFRAALEQPWIAQESAAPTVEEEVVALPEDPALFWSSCTVSGDLFLTPNESSDEPSLLQALANFPFWRSEEPFLPTLERIYRAVRRTGLGVLAGEC